MRSLPLTINDNMWAGLTPLLAVDGRPTWTDCDEAGDYVVPNVLSPRDLVFRPDNMDETVPHKKEKRDQLRSGVG